MTFPRILVAAVVAQLLASVPGRAQERPTDEWLTRPVDRSTFEAYTGFFVFDADLPFRTEVMDEVEDEGVRSEHLRFQGTPGLMITALFFRAQGASVADAPAVVFLHGGGIQGKDAGYLVRLQRFLARAGISVLAIDMWRFGERNDGFLGGGSEQERHDLLYNNDPVYLEWVQQSVKEVSRSFDFLARERGVDPARIGLVGFSRGAVVGMIASAAEDRFGAVALLHGGHFDFLENGHVPAACPANYVGHIEGPVLFLNSERDQDFLLESAIRPIHALAPASAEVYWTSAGGHGATSDEDLGMLAAWLRERLP
jgi:dipeptidyl aminopeptidase/acylaminoacyl peptidase